MGFWWFMVIFFRYIWLVLRFNNLQSTYLKMHLTYFGVFEFAVMHFLEFYWPHLRFYDLQSCIFRVLLDRFWCFLHLRSNISRIFSTAFGLFEICSHASPGFFMTAFPFFGICSQLIPWFCLTYLSILPYAVNSGLVQQKLSCSYIDNERFLLTQDMEIRRRDDITTQLLQNSNKSLSNLWIIQQTVNFQSSLNSKPSIIILHRPF